MIKKKMYKVKKWSEFDHQIHRSVKSFFNEFQLYPNILLANSSTLSTIDTYAYINKEKVRNEFNEILKDSFRFTGLSTFAADSKDYSLELCVNEKLAKDTFLLVYDPEPDFDYYKPSPETSNQLLLVR